MSSPAGWYPQPDGQQRYWDGDQWTEHFAPGVLVSLPVSTPDVSRGSALDARPAYKGFGGGIELSDDTMVIRKTGMAARTLGVVGERRIPLAAVADVRFKDATRLVNGWIQLVLGDEVPGKALASDPNTIVFAHKSQSAFQELRGRLMAVIDTNREQGVNASDIDYDRPAPSRLEKQQGKMQALSDRLEERSSEVAANSNTAKRKGPGQEKEQKFVGIVLTSEGQLICDGESYPVVGATARVETFGQLTERVTSRLTVTRMVGLGVFSLAAPKRKKTKTDTRETYLTVSGQGFEFVKAVNSSQGLAARKFAALVNTRASASQRNR